MPRVDATRITWFLGLQRILRFPRFSFAPTRVLRYLRRPSDQTSDNATSGEAMFRHGVAAAQRIKYPARDALAGRKRIAESIGGSKAATASPRLMTKIATEQPVSKTAVQAPLTPTSVSVRLATLERHIAAKPFADGRISGRRDKSPPLMNFIRASSGSGASAALAPSLRPSPAQLFADKNSDSVKRFPILGTDHSFPRQVSMLAGEESLSSSSATNDQGAFFQGGDATAASEGQRGKAAVSTLHIDGSALGRWTVQHLERALNKPTTGMTGVDPRAAAPRSRVAPF